MTNLNCLSCEELSALLDNCVEPATRVNLYNHLANCQKCSELFNELSSTSATIRKSYEIEKQKVEVSLLDNLHVHLNVCNSIQQDLSAFIDNELQIPGSEGVKSHLKTCTDCLKHFNDLRTLESILLNGLKLKPNLDLNIYQGIKERLIADCKLMKQDFSSFLDQALTVTRHYEITQHLMTCTSCPVEINDLIAVSSMLKEQYKPPKELIIDLLPKIQSKLKLKVITNNKPGRPNKITYIALASAASIVILMLTAFFMLPMDNNSSISQDQSSEGYLLESTLSNEPTNNAEAVLYEQP